MYVYGRLTYHSSHGISLMSWIRVRYIYAHHHSGNIKLPREGQRRVLSCVRARENEIYVRHLSVLHKVTRLNEKKSEVV